MGLTHVCRGNFRSSWIAEGGYEPIAGILLAGTSYDGYFLEYDSGRAGGFEPLRYLPRGKQRVVLGLVTSKFGALESAELLCERIEEAARYAPRAQLALSPHCGFASSEEGNLLSEEEQWTKLKRVVEVARTVGGTTLNFRCRCEFIRTLKGTAKRQGSAMNVRMNSHLRGGKQSDCCQCYLYPSSPPGPPR